MTHVRYPPVSNRIPVRKPKTMDDFVNRSLDVADGARRIFIEIVGTGILLFLDVLLGSMSLAMSFETGAEFVGIAIGPSVIAVLISTATSVIQIVLWRIIFRIDSWTGKLLILMPGLILAVLDTAMDSALSSWVVYQVSPMDFPPPHPSAMYWSVYGIILIVTGFNEPLVEMIRNWNKPKGRAPAQPMQPQNQNNPQRSNNDRNRHQQY